MKLRFIEEYNPVKDASHWYVEKRWWLCVPYTIALDEKKARVLWERCRSLKSVEPVKKVLDAS